MKPQENCLDVFHVKYIVALPHSRDSFWGGESFPATKKLIVEAAWHHPEEQFQPLWNFSRLPSLTLRYINMVQFLSRVPLEEFVQLRELNINHHDIKLEHQEPLRRFITYRFYCGHQSAWSPSLSTMSAIGCCCLPTWFSKLEVTFAV